MFFFTDADLERLNIRGSRDPLGFVPLWSAFGRKVVANVTTASDSVRGFSTLLLGLHFAEQVAEGEANKEEVRLKSFLKFEQLAGYARYLHNGDERLRGITRIKSRLADEKNRRIRIGGSTEHQILSNQKTYGLWGLFTMPAIASGLVVAKDLTLTPAARELVEREYLPVLRDRQHRLLGLISRAEAVVQMESADGRVLAAIADVLKPAFRGTERRFLHEHLVIGGPDAVRTWQPRFAELVERKLAPGEPFSFDALKTVIAAATQAGDTELRAQLQRIGDLEGLLTATANLFSFLQKRDRTEVRKVVGELKGKWGNGLRHIRTDAIDEMRPEIGSVYGNQVAADRLAKLARALHDGAYGDAVAHTLDHNEFVMAERDGAQPWVRAASGKLDVRYNERVGKDLCDVPTLRVAWESTFYLDPLKIISDELRT